MATEVKNAPWTVQINSKRVVHVVGSPDKDGFVANICLVNGYDLDAAKMIASAPSLVAENERLRAALTFYAQLGVVSPITDDAIHEDSGARARNALKEQDHD